MSHTFRGRLECWVAAGLVLVLLTVNDSSADAADDAGAKETVEKAVDYLETHEHRYRLEDHKLGADCLVALALYKAGKPVKHPKIVRAIDGCKKAAKVMPGYNEMYTPALSTVLLCELDPMLYKPQIKKHVDYILSRQQNGGAFGYVSEPKRGDTSQTQFCVWALWQAKLVGFKVPDEAVVRCLNWLMVTQDVHGNWCYKGVVPKGDARIAQGEGTLSLTTAGLFSVYACADMLGFRRKGGMGVPVGRDALVRTQKDGDAWLRKNYSVEANNWEFYYLCGLERYHALRERVDQREEKEFKWYGDSVKFLSKRQEENGCIATRGKPSHIATSFAILCLQRSTKQTLMMK